MRLLSLWLLLALSAGAQTPVWQPAPGHVQQPLWPGKVPGGRPVAKPENETLVVRDHPVAGKSWTLVQKVAHPTLTVYRPEKDATGVAVLVFPGGGYQILAIDLEGTEVCDWLTSRGITAVLVKYRVPGNGLYPKSGAYPNSKDALQDGQRALGLVRYHAAEWGIDPHKIGVLGFSAGGHLVAALSTNFSRRLYPPVDAADRVSCRPDFAVALYPGHLLEHTTRDHQLNPYVPVSRNTPPTFLLQAEDDPVDDVENARVYHDALKKAGVPVEMRLFPHGGHAFGLRRTKEPITAWPELVEAWLGKIGMLQPDHPALPGQVHPLQPGSAP